LNKFLLTNCWWQPNPQELEMKEEEGGRGGEIS
jgi:hypothetical protein